MKPNDNNSLAHTTWNCKYHIVFAPKYRRKEIYGQIKKYIGQILRKLCEQEGCGDHTSGGVFGSHTYVWEYSAAITIIRYIKGKSSLMILDSHVNLKYKYGLKYFWCRGYYVDTVG